MGTFQMDGVSVDYHEGDSIITAAMAANIDIPYLCHHPDYAASGNCRLCVVKVNGRYMAACTTLAQDNMVVENTSQALQTQRQSIVQMLLVAGNHICPGCEKTGHCQLQTAAEHLNITNPKFQQAYPLCDVDMSHPTVWIDYNRCILCQLCVRASQAEGKHIFSLIGRGGETRLQVNTPSGKLIDSTIAADDQAIAVCPVGALMRKPHYD